MESDWASTVYQRIIRVITLGAIVLNKIVLEHDDEGRCKLGRALAGPYSGSQGGTENQPV